MRLSYNNISFAYNGKDVLHELSGEFEPGGFYAIIGPNGSGKSTLIKCLDHLIKPKSGSVLIDDTPIGKFQHKKLARMMGYVPQFMEDQNASTVFDTVMLGRKPHVNWFPGKKDSDLVSRILKDMTLDHLAMRNINELSGGEKQRVHIARALTQEPNILLLDEPTSNLDIKYQVEIMNLLKKISKQKITVIIAIHDLNLALRYAGHYTLLKNGEVIAHGPHDVLTEDILEELYEIRVKKILQDDNIYISPC